MDIQKHKDKHKDNFETICLKILSTSLLFFKLKFSIEITRFIHSYNICRSDMEWSLAHFPQYSDFNVLQNCSRISQPRY